jgi:hypothetical protein
MPTLHSHTHCQAPRANADAKACQRVCLFHRTDRQINNESTTMCIVHKGFRGFRAVSPASILGGNLIGLKPAIPYDTIHSTLCSIASGIEQPHKLCDCFSLQ